MPPSLRISRTSSGWSCRQHDALDLVVAPGYSPCGFSDDATATGKRVATVWSDEHEHPSCAERVGAMESLVCVCGPRSSPLSVLFCLVSFVSSSAFSSFLPESHWSLLTSLFLRFFSSRFFFFSLFLSGNSPFHSKRVLEVASSTGNFGPSLSFASRPF